MITQLGENLLKSLTVKKPESRGVAQGTVFGWRRKNHQWETGREGSAEEFTARG